MSPPIPLGDHWKETLHVQHRSPPDFFERDREIRSTPYAPALRIAFQELSLSAIFCVNKVPTVAIRRGTDYDPMSNREIRSALWNQGLASILVDIVDVTNTVRVFSLARAPTPESGPSSSNEESIIETINAATDSIRRLHSYITGAESGRIWLDHPELFPLNERIDAVLLNNLTVAHDELSGMNLTSEQSQAALIQTLFIAYLEDRDVIDATYFERVTRGQYSNLSGLLQSGQVAALEELFVRLRSDFGGHMFLAPCSFLTSETHVSLSPAHLELLMRFRSGQTEMAQTDCGPLRFSPYDFRYVRIELISAVYDSFSRRNKISSKLKGTHYTQIFLADEVVSSLWSQLTEVQKREGIFFDPACGSGIFLVKILQHLCQHQIDTDPGYTAKQWENLLATMDRIRGYDDDPTTVRVAAFSLYLALLDQMTFDQRIDLLQAGRTLPILRRIILARSDFFTSDCPEFNADIIIGYPPWSSRRNGHLPAHRWASEKGYPFPNREIAWAFTWKALHHLKEGGVLAFLIPSMSFLHNQAKSSIQARSRLFRDYRVKVVVEFSDLRRLLFPFKARSAALIIVRKSTCTSDTPYAFEFLTPKANPHLFSRRIISLSTDDRKWMRSNEVARNGLALKNWLWMRSPEFGLFKYLSQLPTLGSFLDKLSNDDAHSNRMVIGRGFQTMPRYNSVAHPNSSDILTSIPHLPTGGLTPLRINFNGLIPWDSSYVSHRGCEGAFLRPSILMTKGISTRNWRFRAAYVEDPVSFQNAVIAISVPECGESMAKLITAILNSSLSTWFAFHGTKVFGSERPTIDLQDLRRFPLPMPSDLEDSHLAEEFQKKLVQHVESFGTGILDRQVSAQATDRALKEIDQLAYRYFGLNDDEIALIEETIDSVLPAVQPGQRTIPEIWRGTTVAERRLYSHTLVQWLSGWFSAGFALSVRMFARNADYAIMEVSISAAGSRPYTEGDAIPFPEALSALQDGIGQPIAGNFCLTLDFRAFLGSKVYFVKPLQKRYWLHGSALADAGAIVSDLEAHWQQSLRKEGIS